MKKSVLILSALILGFVFAGCTSAPVDISGNSPMAIMSVKGNSNLPWYEVKDGKETAATQGMVSKIIDDKLYDEDPELVTGVVRLDYAEEYLRQTMKDNLGVEVMDKADVVSLKKYKSISEGLLSGLNTSIAATDYKVLDSVSASELRRFYKESNAKGAVILKFEFFKKLVSGSKSGGDMVPYIKMIAKVYDEKGKEIFYKTYRVQGNEKFRFARKDYDKAAFVDLYPPVIESAINQFTLEFVK